ncbi:MAG: hypothetical protein ACOXZS_01600 [Bacilli bacterium]
MFCRIFFFLLGFGLMVIGSMYIILYTNLMTIDYSLSEYFNFISHRFECLLSIIGFIIVTITIFWKKGDNHEIRL